MAKLKDKPISKEDVKEYLQEYSDFSFEIKVLRKFISMGFDCYHSGTYEDPITKKTREFDIRANKHVAFDNTLHLNLSFSVECKNIRNNFPLVIHCMPRKENECYLNLIWSSEPQHYIPPYVQSKSILATGSSSPYKTLGPNGKSCDQIGRREAKSGELVGNDGKVFDKISQAINSSYDMIVEGHYAAKKGTDVVTIVVPVLVVPNGRIWTVWYEQSGEIKQEPELTGNIEYFIGKSWTVGDPSREYARKHVMSHMEIVQIGELEYMVNKYTEKNAIKTAEGLKSVKEEALLTQKK